KARRRRNLVLGVLTAVVVVALAFVLWWTFRGDPDDPTPTASTTASAVPQVVPPNASADDLGINANPLATDPLHTLVIYGDYQCSGCAIQEEALKDVLAEAVASTTVQVEFRNRDFLDEDAGHGNMSRPASIAAACADVAGDFFDYHMKVYDHYGELDDTVLRETIPGELGWPAATVTSFQTCHDNKSTANFVDSVEKAADEAFYNAGITSTPTFILDGEAAANTQWLVDGQYDLDKARAALGL
ncbi:MAG: thioredoxin domain-containing protein, partial [Propionibacteriaceae bacterium]|nr:thioredoxin domain-containing protein [Propionibacteriaceae bacterium]